MLLPLSVGAISRTDTFKSRESGGGGGGGGQSVLTVSNVSLNVGSTLYQYETTRVISGRLEACIAPPPSDITHLVVGVIVFTIPTFSNMFYTYLLSVTATFSAGNV